MLRLFLIFVNVCALRLSTKLNQAPEFPAVADAARLQMEPNEAMDDPMAELLNDFLIHRDMKMGKFFRSPERVDELLKFAARSDGLPKTANIFAFTHHKSGTHLSAHLLKHGADLTRSPWFQVARGHESCMAGHTGIYNNFNTKTIANLNAQCHDFRAFHVIRESVALTASGYLYHKRSNDAIPGTGPQILKSAKSLKDALSIEAKAEAQTTLPEMVACHEILKDDPRVLTVRMEDFHEHFDETVRSIFMHLYGKDFKDLDKLVSEASVDDVSRWSSSELANTPHVADDSDRSKVLDMLKSMLREQDAGTAALSAADEKMSYKVPRDWW